MDMYASGLNNNAMSYRLHPNYRSKLIGVDYSREKRVSVLAWWRKKETEN